MRCVRCGRPLGGATVSIPSRDGPLDYGPRCARLAGVLREPRARIGRPVRRRRVHLDQLQLEFSA